VIAFLASSQASCITGAVIAADGGVPPSDPARTAQDPGRPSLRHVSPPRVPRQTLRPPT
jgi:hypothetical protein